MIFLPIVFDGEGSYEPALTSRIPDPPQITILPEPKQTRPVIIADSDIPAVAPSATDVDQTVSADQASESVPARTGYEGTLPQLGVDGLPAVGAFDWAYFPTPITLRFC